MKTQTWLMVAGLLMVVGCTSHRQTVTISVDPAYLAEFPQSKALAVEAAQTWNDALGFEAIQVVDQCGECMHLTYKNAPKPGYIAWTTTQYHNDGETTGNIGLDWSTDEQIEKARATYAFQGTNDEFRLPVLVHEMGHALGVPHENDDIHSVMHPVVSRMEWEITKTSLEHVQWW